MKVRAVQPSHSDSTATDIAAPRMRLGKISLITTQVTGAKRHRVAGDGRDHEDQHQQAFELEIVGRPQHGVDAGQAGGPDQHQWSPPQSIDGEDGDEREDQIDDAGDHDAKHQLTHLVARCLKHLLGVVEDDVDAAPLLEHGQEHAQADDPHQLGFREIAEADLGHFFVR